MSKTFTSAAVGLCVADGLFGYDDLVAELFADVVDGELGPHAASMKVRDVLAMAGGHSDTLAAGVTGTREPAIVPFKGEYHLLAPARAGQVHYHLLTHSEQTP